jgi:hypothetical protein
MARIRDAGIIFHSSLLNTTEQSTTPLGMLRVQCDESITSVR